MHINLQITHSGKIILLSEAIKKGYVEIDENEIKAQENVTISLSSRLFDCKGKELFENDIVRAGNGKQYKIIYDFGIFYLSEIDAETITPLYIYKLGNTVDVEKIIL